MELLNALLPICQWEKYFSKVQMNPFWKLLFPWLFHFMEEKVGQTSTKTFLPYSFIISTYDKCHT